MKKIIYIIFSAIVLISCYDNAEYNKPVDIAFVKDKSDNNAFTYRNVGDVVIIRDCSQGELYHEWSVDNGAQFISNAQDTSTVTPGCLSTNKDAYVLLKKSGITTIKLKNIYDRQVASNEKYPVVSIKDGQNWIYEQEFKIEGYGVLKPSYKVVLNSTEGKSEDILEINGSDDNTISEPVEITINQGDTLLFEYDLNSEYKGEVSNWIVQGGAKVHFNSDNSIVKYVFNNATTEPLDNFSISVKRDAIFGIGQLAASVTKKIPLLVNVNKTALKPIDTPSQDANFYISIPLNKAVMSLTDNQKENIISAFTLKTINEFDNSEEIVNIREAKVESNRLLLLPDNFSARYKKCYLSYNNEKCKLYGFDDKEMALPMDSFLDMKFDPYVIFNPFYFSFNIPTLEKGWWVNKKDFVDILSKKETQLNVLEVKHNGSDDIVMVISLSPFEQVNIIKSGKYKLKFKLFVEGSIENAPSLQFRFLKVDTSTDKYQYFMYVISDNLESDKWNDVEYDIELLNDSKLDDFCISFNGTSDVEKRIFIDDIFME